MNHEPEMDGFAKMSADGWWAFSIKEPGVYYFVGAFGDDANEVHVYNVKRDHLGELYVDELARCQEQWGPDRSKLAITRPGLWKLVPEISEQEFNRSVVFGLSHIRDPHKKGVR